MLKNDLYIILEIAQSASTDDIKRSYRKLARRYHPDVNPGDRSAEERFKRITEAYEVLSDTRKRKIYDERGCYSEDNPAEDQSNWNIRFEGFDFGGRGDSPFGDIFSRILSEREATETAGRGADIEYPITISFEQSVSGVQARITVFRGGLCPVCSGAGRAPGALDSSCRACEGSGKISQARGRLRFSTPCNACRGTGRVSAPCETCRGDGRIPRSESLDVDIPPGAATGTRIRVAGKGEPGPLGVPPGDLYVVTNVTPHPFFSRLGDNVHCRVPITFTEAALGARIEVPTLDGRALLRIPPGTQSGQNLRLRGRGSPSLRDPMIRGDQYVEVRVVVPRIGDERSKEILREFGRLNPDDPRAGVYGYGG